MSPVEFVLVHGLAHGAWCWQAVIAGLDRHGLAATAVELPLTGLADDAAAARAALEGRARVVLVGHSYGGSVVSAAGHRALHLVYIAGVVPDRGESNQTLAANYERTPLAAALRYSEDGSTFTVDPAEAANSFYNALPPEQAAPHVARLRPTGTLCRTQPLAGEPAWRTVPSTFLICERDHALATAWQEDGARRAGSAVVRHAGDHCPMVSAPDVVVDVLVDVAGRAAGTGPPAP